MIKNIYGTTIDTEVPITGVIDLNKCPEWVLQDAFYDCIDLNYEVFKKELNQELESGLIDLDDYNNQLENYESDITTYLLGTWLKDSEGLYYPDQSGLYSAIYDNNDNIIQVVFSTSFKRCNHCPPCYPGQGDLNTIGDFLTYNIPD